MFRCLKKNKNNLYISFVIFFGNHIFNGTYTKLIEKCTFPWVTYKVAPSLEKYGYSNECGKICFGNAFYTTEGKLLCFNKKHSAHFKFVKQSVISDEIPENDQILCECGYRTRSREKGNFTWTSCDLDIAERTKGHCKKRCDQITMYFYQRRNKKTLLVCEEHNIRQTFHKIVGEVGGIMRREPSFSRPIGSSYRNCICGINNHQVLYPVIDDFKSTEEKIFEECSSPWRKIKILSVSSVESCTPYCQKICGKGKGLIRNGKAFCYHRSARTTKKTVRRGALRGTCDCGYVKCRIERNQEPELTKKRREFVHCEPPIHRDNITVRDCNELCRESVAFIYKTHRKPLNVRCIQLPNFDTMKVHQLLAECDEEVHESQYKVKYMYCRCGLNMLGDNMKSETGSTGIEIPSAWPVKKKRTPTACKLSKKEEIA